MRFVLIIIAFLVVFFPIYINVSAFAKEESVYSDYWEVQDPEGEFEIESKYLGEKVRVTRTSSKRISTSHPDYPEPLKVGMKWENPDLPGAIDRDDNMYAYYVEAIEDVTVPAGSFKCFRITFRTCPDDTIEWFCPGVGIVKIEYHHHGTITNYTSELIKRGSHE